VHHLQASCIRPNADASQYGRINGRKKPKHQKVGLMKYRQNIQEDPLLQMDHAKCCVSQNLVNYTTVRTRCTTNTPRYGTNRSIGVRSLQSTDV